MPRAHFNKAVLRRVSGTPTNGSVQVFDSGTTTPLAQTMYVGDTGAAVRTNPFSFTNGVIDFFLDEPQRVRLVVTPDEGSPQTFDAVDVYAPSQPYLSPTDKAADSDLLDGLDSTEFVQADSYRRTFLTGA